MKAKKARKDHAFFDRWARRHQMRPICRVVEDESDILIADSGTRLERRGESGVVEFFYLTAFAFERPGDALWIASTNETDVFSPEMVSRSDRGKQQYRINEALAYARKYLKDLKQARMFTNEGDRRITRSLAH